MSDDPINPKHYRSHPSGVEVIEVVENLPFCIGNAWKYVARADMKNGVEDLRKGEWYLDREIGRRRNVETLWQARKRASAFRRLHETGRPRPVDDFIDGEPDRRRKAFYRRLWSAACAAPSKDDIHAIADLQAALECLHGIMEASTEGAQTG